MGKELKEKKKDEVAVLGDEDKGYGDNLSNDDLLLPRVDLLQALSPVVVSGEKKPGQIINNITQEDLGSPSIIPIYLTKNWIRWKPRNEGGGIIWRSNDPTDPRVIEETKWVNNEKPLATAYFNFLCLVEGEDVPIVLSFSMTSYQAGRKLFTLTKMTPGPIYSCKYKLSAVSKTNNFGTFFVFDVTKEGPASEEDQAKASDLKKMFAGKELNFDSERTEKTSTNGLSDEF